MTESGWSSSRFDFFCFWHGCGPGSMTSAFLRSLQWFTVWTLCEESCLKPNNKWQGIKPHLNWPLSRKTVDLASNAHKGSDLLKLWTRPDQTSLWTSRSLETTGALPAFVLQLTKCWGRVDRVCVCERESHTLILESRGPVLPSSVTVVHLPPPPPPPPPPVFFLCPLFFP